MGTPTSATPATTGTSDSAAPRDGQHGFDFAFGSWDVSLQRLLRPLTGSIDWVEYEGTSVCRPLWDGRANIDELCAYSAEADASIDGLTLRLYNAESGEWSLYWANASNGVLSMPPTVGRFTDDGRGEFFDQEELDGRPIVVRYEWSDITPTSARFEQAFSPDEGATWETNWICTITRKPA
ncbi:MAG: hypothetical protein ACRDGD_00850 [Candidatus Limnocylindria bacterium]